MGVLVIEEEGIEVRVRGGMVEDRGMGWVWWMELEELLDGVGWERFDVLVRDVEMGGMKGLEVLKVLGGWKVGEGEGIGVIGVRGGRDMKGEELKEYGFGGWVEKGFRVGEVLGEVNGEGMGERCGVEREVGGGERVEG